MRHLTDTNRLEPTLYEWPQAYFDIQYLFAKRIVDLEIASDLPTAVLKYTTIFRRLYSINPTNTNDLQIPSEWNELCRSVNNIWSKYISDSSNLHVENPDHRVGCYYGSFFYKPFLQMPIIIDQATGQQKIELHFNNHRGSGKSEFSRANLQGMSKNLVDLFQSVARRMKVDHEFQPEFVTLGSWLNVFPGIINVFPKEFVDSGITLYPPQLSFNGDSLWGQFLTNNGGVNQKRYQLFLKNINKASDINSLIDSFPFPVIFYRSQLSIFFSHYQTIR